MIDRIEAMTAALRAGDDDIPDLEAVLAEIAAIPDDALRPDAPALAAAIDELVAVVRDRMQVLTEELDLVARRRTAAAGFGYLEPRRRFKLHTRA